MGGEIVFSADTFNLPATYMTVLVDLQNNTTTDLSAGTYTATIEPNTSAFNRFVLRTSFVTSINGKAKKGAGNDVIVGRDDRIVEQRFLKTDAEQR
jgi:hypothetical protein